MSLAKVKVNPELHDVSNVDIKVTVECGQSDLLYAYTFEPTVNQEDGTQ
jgi:hypothetical protein